MSSVDLLISLPESLAGVLLSQWIDIEHLYKVDTAYCHKANRLALAAVYKSPQLLLSNKAYTSFKTRLPSNLISWCVVRGLKFWEFYLTADIICAPQTENSEDSIQAFMGTTGAFLKRFDCHANMCPPFWLWGLASYACQLEFLYFDTSLAHTLISAQATGVVISRNQRTLRDLTLKITTSHPIPLALSETNPVQLVSPEFHFPHLTDLELSITIFPGGELNIEKMIENAPNLQHLTLDVRNSPFGGTQIASVSALRALRNRPDAYVKNIILHGLDAESATLLPAVCPTGPALELNFAANITSGSFRTCVTGCANVVLISTPMNFGLDAVTSQIDTLKTLSLRRGIDFDAQDLATLVARCTALTTLSICHLHQLESTELETIARVVPPSVRVLTLYDMDVNDYVLSAIAATAPQLTELHISSSEECYDPFSQEGLLHIAQLCTQLTKLDLGRHPEDVLGTMALYLWQKLCPTLSIFDNSEAYEEEIDMEDDDMMIGF